MAPNVIAVVLAMDAKSLGAAGLIALVVVIALLARAAGSRDGSSGSGGMVPLGGAPPEGADTADTIEPETGDDDDDFENVEVAAVTSDGYALVPDRHAVRLVPPNEEGEAWKAGTTTRNRRGERALDMSWHAGDFTGARVVRGAADEGPWRFEALGRDGEYAAFVFETREGADAALGVFQSRNVIRHGHDEDDNETPPSAEQFEEARRVFLETEAALDHDDDGA